jgi:hypothetical protein
MEAGTGTDRPNPNNPPGSGRGHGLEVKPGVEVGSRVAIPRGAQSLEVYINGVVQKEGLDYEVSAAGDKIIFRDPIVKEGKLGMARWFFMFIGLFGSYGKNEAIDLHYTLNGAMKVATDVPVLPD